MEHIPSKYYLIKQFCPLCDTKMIFTLNINIGNVSKVLCDIKIIHQSVLYIYIKNIIEH